MKPRKQLDHVVRFGLGVMVTSFALIFGGMFLTRPDRSIPPYTVGSQEETAVAVHVPSWTSDGEIETLIRRFSKVARETRDFGTMKIHPTTPGKAAGRYQRLIIYVFAEEKWTAPDVLHRYLTSDDEDLQGGFEKAVRGWYRLDGLSEEGRIGPILGKEDSPATAAYSRVLFKGSLKSGSEMPGETRARGDDALSVSGSELSKGLAQSRSASVRADQDL